MNNQLLLSKNKRSNNKGFSLIELLVVMVTIGIVAAISIPNLLVIKRLTNEASAIQSLRVIGMSQHLYQASIGGGKFATLTQLKNSGYINPVLGTAPFRKDRYLFEMDVLAADPATGLSARFNARARPLNHTIIQPLLGAGTRDFGTNELGRIYQTSNATKVLFDATTRLPTGTAVLLKQTGGAAAPN
jgi:prepilin-type N-terminal cleavage/methylation domain-containing protein